MVIYLTKQLPVCSQSTVKLNPAIMLKILSQLSRDSTKQDTCKSLLLLFYILLPMSSRIQFLLSRIPTEADSVSPRPGLERQPDLFLLLNRVRMKCWLLHDSMHRLPKSFLYLKFSAGCASQTPKDSAINHLLVLLIQVRVTMVSWEFWKVVINQCDQMARICVQYWDIYSNKNVLWQIAGTICQSRFNI